MKLVMKGELVKIIVLIMLSLPLAAGAVISVDNPWIPVWDDDNRTETVRISVSDFGSNEVVNVSVAVQGRPVTNVLSPQTIIRTDANGSGFTSFKPARNTYSGRAKVVANSPTHNATLEITDDTFGAERVGLTFENVFSSQETAGGRTIDFQMHYTNESLELAGAYRIEPLSVLTAVKQSFRTHVDQWGFNEYMGAYDLDGTAHVYMGYGDNGTFHGYSGRYSWSSQGGLVRVWINYRSTLKKYFAGNGWHYPSELANVGHEHFHSIQFAYGRGGAILFPSDWYMEGMARFSETVLDPDNVFDPNALFFQSAADNGVNFLTDNPDYPFNKFQYSYALYWAHLYDVYNDDITILKDVLNEIRNYTSGSDSDTAGPAAITAALASRNGRYRTFNESVIGFAKALYKKDFRWANKDWSTYLRDVSTLVANLNQSTTIIAADNRTGEEFNTTNEADVNYWASDFIRLNRGAYNGFVKVEFSRYTANASFVPTLIIKRGSSYEEKTISLNGLTGNVTADLSNADDVVLIVTNAGATGDKRYNVTVTKVDIDLVAGVISFSKDSVMLNQLARISLQVQNNGTDQLSTTVRFSDNGVAISGGDVSVVVPAHGTANASITWTPTRAGLHNVSAFVDPDNRIRESNENNNAGNDGFYVASPMGIPGNQQAGVKNSRTYETTLDVRNMVNMTVTLSWPGSNDLDLVLVQPSGALLTAPQGQPESIFVNRPANGTWRVRIFGRTVAGNWFQQFTIATAGFKLLGGINFTNINLNYVSSCDPSKLTFVIKGIEGDGEQSFSLEEAQQRTLKYFKTGLTIPNYKQWISLPLGGVDVDPVFAQTEVARVMLQQDARMKNSTLPEICSVWSEWNPSWDTLVDVSPYAAEIRAAGYNRHPQGWIRFAIINDFVNATGDSCTVFIEGYTPKVEMSALDTPIYLDFSGFNFRQEIVDDFNSRLKTWRQQIHASLNQRVKPSIQEDVSLHQDFRPVRELYPMLAIAQWYKRLPRENLQLADLIDTEDLAGLEAEVPFDADYWRGQSDQVIQYNASCGLRGGVSLTNLQTSFQGEMSEEAMQAVDEAVAGAIAPYNGAALFGGQIEQNKPDLIASGQWILDSIPTSVEQTVSFSLNNLGQRDAGPFTVTVQDDFTNLQGFRAVYPMHVENVASLQAEGFAGFDFQWNPEHRVGQHKLLIRVDSGNDVRESDETNNEGELQFSVYSPLPEASLVLPTPGRRFTYGDEILFSGSAVDQQDGQLNGEALEWSSSIDGVIGYGESFALANLSSGNQVITLTARDSDGNIDREQVGIVVDPAKPSASIQYPDGQIFYKPADLITFRGSASDREDGELHGAALQWSSNIDSALGSGNEIVLNASLLSTGTHFLTLTATDSDGLSGTDESYFIVVPAEAKTLNTFYDNSTNATIEFDGGEADEFLYVNISRNSVILSAVLTAKGQSSGSSEAFNFTEEFDNQTYRSVLTTANWNGGKLVSRSPIPVEGRILNPSFGNNAESWTGDWHGVGDVQEGGKCPWFHNYACWGWRFTQLFTGSYSKIFQQNIDFTGVDMASFTYFYGGDADGPVIDSMSFMVDNDRLWNYAPPRGSPPLYRYGDSIYVNIGSRSGLHTLSFARFIEGPSDWYWYFFDGGSYWKTSAVDDVKLWRNGFTNSTAVSTVIYNAVEPVTQATLNAVDDLSGGAVIYYLSADNGVHWEQTQKSVVHVFQYPGTQVRWKAELVPGSELATPIVYSVNVEALAAYPVNPFLDVGNDASVDWMHEGVYAGSEVIDFKPGLQSFLDDPEQCNRQEDLCLVPLRFHSDSRGKLFVYNLSINYLETDNKPPQIYSAEVTQPLYPRDSAILTANIYENKELSNVTAEINGRFYAMHFNSSLPQYDIYDLDFVAGIPETYEALVTAVDSNNLVSTRSVPFTVRSRGADLAVRGEEIEIDPEVVSENVPATVNAFVYNYGEQNASNVSIALYVGGELQGEQRVDVNAGERVLVALSWPAPVYGSRILEVRADAANEIVEESEENNAAQKVVEVIDLSGPAAPEVSAEPAGWTNRDTFTVSWNELRDAAGIARYEYSLDYGAWQSNGLQRSFVTPPQGQGLHIVRVRGVDGAGNLGREGFTELKVDQTPPNAPVVRETQLHVGWNQLGSALFRWTNPGDYGSGVDNYTASIDGVEMSLGNILQYSTTFTDGEHLFKTKALDALGQQSAWSNEITVRVDGSAPLLPEVSSTTHPDQVRWYAANVSNLSWTAPADLSGIYGYYYWIDGERQTIPSPGNLAMFTVNNSLQIRSLPRGLGPVQLADGLPEGNWYFHVRPRDNAGNVANGAAHYRLNIDGTAPTTTDSSDSEWHNSSYALTLMPLDMLSGVSATHYTVDGSNPTLDSPSGVSVVFPGTGNYSVKYFSVDNAGNVEQVRAANNSVFIDATPPVIAVYSPAEGFVSPFEPLVFNFTAVDAHSGLREVRAYLDGVEVRSGDSVDLPDDFRYYNFTVYATDNVGNPASYFLNFSTGLLLQGEGQFKVTPEVLRVNPGVMMAHLNFPVPFEDAAIVSATLDGAPMDQIVGGGVKFRRTTVEEYLRGVNQSFDTHFVIFGQFQLDGRRYYFRGEDDITEVRGD